MSVLNLPIHTSETRSRPASSARLVNCHAELAPPGAKTPVKVVRSPGIQPWTVVGTGPIKAVYADVDYTDRTVKLLYVVSGHELYSVTTEGVPTLIGSIGSIPTFADMDSNTIGLCVVNEPRAYTYDGTTFGEITDDDFVTRGAGDVEFLDNYLLFREPNSGRFFGADTGSLTSFNALQFAIADNNPDDLTGLITDSRQMIAFGAKVSEIFENTGVSGFPFERNINGTIESGCKNGRTVARQDSIVMWVADDLTVRRLEGVSPVRISTHAVEQFLASATIDSGFAFTYEQDGHFFYVLTFNEGTWLFDITTGEWHERESYMHANWRVSCHAQFNGLELVGDLDSNNIGYLDYDYHYDWDRYSKNYIRHSNEASNAIHSATRINVTENAIIGPSGAMDADKIYDDGSASTSHYYRHTTEDISGSLVTHQIKVKAGEYSWIGFADAGAVKGRFFDVTNGVEGGVVTTAPTSSSIVADKNGFFLCKITTNLGGTTGKAIVYLATGDGTISYNGDGASGVYVADYQTDAGSESSLFIHTGASAKSRWGVQRMEWTYQPVYAEQQRAFHDRLEVVMEMGVGATTGQGIDPKIMCEYSDDGGMTWKSLPDISLGALGKRKVRAYWTGLGSARQRVYRMAVSDPVQIIVTDTLLEVRGGRL